MQNKNMQQMASKNYNIFDFYNSESNIYFDLKEKKNKNKNELKKLISNKFNLQYDYL